MIQSWPEKKLFQKLPLEGAQIPADLKATMTNCASDLAHVLRTATQEGLVLLVCENNDERGFTYAANGF